MHNITKTTCNSDYFMKMHVTWNDIISVHLFIRKLFTVYDNANLNLKFRTKCATEEKYYKSFL